MAFVGSFAATLLVEWSCRALQLFDNPSHRKIHKLPVPRLGGIAFFVIPAILSFWIPMQFTATLFLGAFIVYVGGFYDDLNPANSALVKLAFQVPAAFIFAFTLPLEFLEASIPVLIILRILMGGYVLFMINAANLMDNMNGLTSGLSILWLLGLAFLGTQTATTLLMIPALLVMAASVLGFYLRNFPWGKIYMGDQGSQLLGYMNAAMSLLVIPRLVQGNAGTVIGVSMIVILLFSLVFVVDVFTVTFIRLKEGRPVWQGDQSHLSHQLVRRGFSQTKSALILSGLQGVVTGLGCYSLLYFFS
jgi:UDP-GlcNAc:undecaprenyl-phosphate GlcNAc-1-phosphate transferase